MQFFAKYHTNRFHILQLLFRISGSSEKENKSKPKNSAGEFIGSEEIFFEGKRVRWQNYYRTSYMLSSDQRMLGLKMEGEELRRTRRTIETLM